MRDTFEMEADMTPTQQLRDALGVASDYVLPAAEVERLRSELKHIKPLLMLFTPRTGSTYLGHELHRTQAGCFLEEWFNWYSIPEEKTAEQETLYDYFIDKVHRYTTESNLFGIKFTWPQFLAINEIVPISSLFSNPITWLSLRRRNIVAQAISVNIADQTQIFHSFQIAAERDRNLSKVLYDQDTICETIEFLIFQETALDKWLAQNNASPLNIFYEDLVEDSESTVRAIMSKLGVEPHPAWPASLGPNPCNKLEPELNLKFEARFRNENDAFIKSIEAKRQL